MVVILLFLLGRILTKLADAAALGILNKLLGAVFGTLKIGLILSVILIIFDNINNTLPFIYDERKDSAILYKPVKSLVPMIFPKIFKDSTGGGEPNNNPLE